MESEFKKKILGEVVEIEESMVAFEVAWKLFGIGFETLDVGFARVVEL